MRKHPSSAADEGQESVGHSPFYEAALSSIPDFVYAFDRLGRFTYANRAMLELFGLTAEKMLGKTFAELGYPPDLADRLNGYITCIFLEGVTVEDEVFYTSPTGFSAYFSFVWGPVFGADGSVQSVVGVSRDTSQRHSFEDQLKRSETRLRAATDLVGIGIYSWDPVSGELDWDERVRELWGLAPGAQLNMDIFLGAIQPDDLPRVKKAIRACTDPEGTGLYDIEYRVIGLDGVTRCIATKGRTGFSNGRATSFIGAAIDVSEQRRNEAAVRSSESQFRSFANHSSNLIWIADPAKDTIVYRSSAFERIWGLPIGQAPSALVKWLEDVHQDDRESVENALTAVKNGEVRKFDYRIVRPLDGSIRRLHDTSFPIRDETGTVFSIGGITEDLTPANMVQVYLVCKRTADARRLADEIRRHNYRVRTFSSAEAFLDIAQVLNPGCVVVDLRNNRKDGLKIPRELKARAVVTLRTILLDSADAEVGGAVSAMKAGAADYLIVADNAFFRASLAGAIAECASISQPQAPDESASARLSRLTSRESEVLVGLVAGGTNKTIGLKLGISPRTVELHRSQVMNKLDASSLTELLQIAWAAGLRPSD